MPSDFLKLERHGSVVRWTATTSQDMVSANTSEIDEAMSKVFSSFF